MLVYVESYYGDALLSGKVSSIGQLKSRMHDVLRDTPAKDFVPVFCARYQFDVLPMDPAVIADYGIDLDTHLVLQVT